MLTALRPASALSLQSGPYFPQSAHPFSPTSRGRDLRMKTLQVYSIVGASFSNPVHASEYPAAHARSAVQGFRSFCSVFPLPKVECNAVLIAAAIAAIPYSSLLYKSFIVTRHL